MDNYPRCIPFQYGNKLQEFITLHAQQYLHFLCENDQSAILLAKCNYGAAILPEIYIPAHREGIVVLPFSEELKAIEYGIAYHRNLKEKHIKQFIQLFLERLIVTKTLLRNVIIRYLVIINLFLDFLLYFFAL